jgi:hypothetical protein
MPAPAAGHIDGRRYPIPHLPPGDAMAQLDHLAGQFVAEDAWQVAEGLPPGEEMEVGAAQATGPHPNQHFTRARSRDRAVHHFERAAVSRDDDRAHAVVHHYCFNPVIAMP